MSPASGKTGRGVIKLTGFVASMPASCLRGRRWGKSVSQFWRSCLYAVLATCLVGLGLQAPAWAKQAASPSELRPLSDVLDALSREYHRSIVASPDLLRGRMASVPQTAASLEAALTGLLEIQSLDFDVLESGVVVIRTAPSPTVTPQAMRAHSRRPR